MNGAVLAESHGALLAKRAELRTILREELSAILKIPVDTIDLSKNLDEYGVDSIDAVIATGAIADRLGLDLAPELLIQHRSFDAIADAIWGISRRSAARRQARAPVYLFAGGAGRDGRLSRLADRCGAAASFEPITLGTWQQWSRDRSRLDDLVRQASALILASSNGDAVRIAGYSQGSQIAYAVARHLSAHGHRVEWLCIFDGSPEPFRGVPIRGRKWSWPLRVARYVLARMGSRRMRVPRARTGNVMVGAEEGEMRSNIALRLAQLLPDPVVLQLMKLTGTRSRDFLEGRGGTRVNINLQLLYFSVLWRDWWQSEGRNCPAIDVPTTLFRSEDPGAEDRGWGRYLRALKIVHVRGSHTSMFDPENLDDLADRFIEILSEPRVATA